MSVLTYLVLRKDKALMVVKISCRSDVSLYL